MTHGDEDVTGLVLAGGRGSRMGGVDKGLQSLEGKPLVQHALSRLSPQVATVMINANRHLDVPTPMRTLPVPWPGFSPDWSTVRRIGS
jgi:molybdopterin-guanine dinucleotide biosynthesis protein A